MCQRALFNEEAPGLIWSLLAARGDGNMETECSVSMRWKMKLRTGQLCVCSSLSLQGLLITSFFEERVVHVYVSSKIFTIT